MSAAAILLLSLSSTSAAGRGELPPIERVVSAATLLGVGLAVDHYDEAGFPETKAGLLVTEVDPKEGAITFLEGHKPYFLEAQFANVQRDAVLFARLGPRVDQRPDGTAFEIPYGQGALKTNTSVVTLVEAKLEPHFADNQKSYQLFPLTDLYIGGSASFTGIHGDARYVYAERYVGYTGLGLNLLALAGGRVNATFGAFAVPITLGGGYRYPAPLTFLGTHWTSGFELDLGAIAADDDPGTNRFIVLPGVVHEIEWTFARDLERSDYRSDPRPSDWGLASFFGRIGLYADAFSGSGGSGGLVFDLTIGYRFNLLGPEIPPHAFKETRVTFASERYVERKREEETRRRALEERLKDRATP